MSFYSFGTSPIKQKCLDQWPKNPQKVMSPLKNMLNLEKRPSELIRRSEELRMLKLLAIEKERMMMRKRRAAIKIQKIYRGWLKRRAYLRYK
jgi:hypothetical protein